MVCTEWTTYFFVRHSGGGGRMWNYMAIRAIDEQIAQLYVVDVVGSHKQCGANNFLLSLTRDMLMPRVVVYVVSSHLAQGEGEVEQMGQFIHVDSVGCHWPPVIK